MSEQPLPEPRRLLRWFVLPFVVLLLLVGVVFGWLVGTESGLRAGTGFARAALPDGFELGDVSGRLIGPLEIADLKVTTETAIVAIKRIRADWQPAALFGWVARIDSVFVEGVDVQLLEAAPQEPAEPFQLPEQMSLPVGLEFALLKVVDVRVYQKDREFLVSEVTAGASWIDTKVELSQLRVMSPLADLTAVVALDAQGSYPLTAMVEHNIRLENLAPVVGVANITESLLNPKLLWTLEAPWSTSIDAGVENLFSDPSLKAKLEFSADSLAKLGADFPAYKSQLSLTANGAFDKLAVQGSAQVEGSDIQAFHAEIATQIQPAFIELENFKLSISGQPQPVIAVGQIDLLAEPRVDLTVSWEQLLVPSKEALEEVLVEAGRLQVVGPLDNYLVKGGMRVDYLGYETPLSLSGNGSQSHFVLNELIAALGEPSRHRLAVNGQEIDLTAEAVSPDEILEANKGELVLSGRVDFASDLRILANVRGSNLNPGQYVADLPGLVALETTVEVLQTKDGVLRVDLPRLSIKGTVVGEALLVNGIGRWQDDRGTISRFDGRWGAYVLQADGELGPESDLTWRFALPDLDQVGQLLGETWRGAVDGDGKILGPLASPRIVVNAKAVDVHTTDAHLKSMTLTMDAAVEGQVDAALLLVGADVGGQQVDSVDLKINGTSTDHSLQLAVEADRADLSAEGRGSLKHEQGLGIQAWAFDLTALELIHPDLDVAQVDHRWSLSTPVSGSIGAESVQLQKLCLSHEVPVGGGSLCVEAEVSKQLTRAALALDSLRLANLNGLLPDDVQLVGTLDGDAQWNGHLAETQANFFLDAVRMQVRKEADNNSARKGAETSDDEWLAVASFAPGRISVRPEEHALKLEVHLPLAESVQDGVFAEVSLTPQANEVSAKWPMLGDINIRLPDLAWVAAVVEPLTSLAGGFDSEVALSGTLEGPLIGGRSTLTLASAEIADLGLKLRDARFRLLGTQNGLELEGTANSGGGSLQLTSTVGWEDGLDVRGTMTGEEFVVSNTPEARVSISPDLRVSYDKEILTLRGDVVVPLADIRLNKVPTGAVSASKDQRFLLEETTAAPLETDVRVRLVLGDDVHFQGLGLDAKFTGALAIQDSSNKATTATGEIDIVEGGYKAYGQDLTINDGKVIFAGGPIEEPGLDVRAIRQATPEVLVGVHVRGSLREPVLNVFSTPSLPQSDQLSYLVLGRPLSSSSASENSLLQQAAMAIGVQGGELFTDKIGKSLGVDTIGIESAPGTSNAQAALVVGKYLSPKLYVSYGYGLFEPISTLRLEYQLGRLWRVVTESTNNATGGDFIWVRER